MTIKQRLIAGLTARGFRQVPSKSRKFETFTKDSENFYFVGKSGALRRGRTCTASVPADRFKNELLCKEAEKAYYLKNRQAAQ